MESTPTTNTTAVASTAATTTKPNTNINSNTTTATTNTYLKIHNNQTPTKPKRRKCKETTITILPTIVSPDNTAAWCCPATKPPLPTRRHAPIHPPSPHPGSEPIQAGSPFRIRFSPGNHSPVMEFSPISMNAHSPNESLGFSKFNSVLTAGLLNPMSPPPRSSPTLFEMMANEPDIHPRTTAMSQINNPQNPITNTNPNPNSTKQQQLTAQDKKDLILQRIWTILNSKPPGNLFNDSETSDIGLTLSSKDGISVTLDVHRQILVAHSTFFGVQLSDQWLKQQRGGDEGSVLGPYNVEIADCEDVEVYVETLRLMYCDDLRRMLMKQDVGKVLGILKVSATIGFDAGVFSCLEYLEAAPWPEDEEESVASLLSKLCVDGVAASEVLKRVSMEHGNGTEAGNDNEEVLVKLLHVVLEGKDERARRDMKGLVSKMLRENSSQRDIRKDSFYSACDGCLQLLRKSFRRAAESDLKDVGQIARQADNLYWILDILIDRQIAEDFLKKWASQTELAEAHSKVPAVHRYEISRVTARLFVGIGKGQLLASKDSRCLLLRTWLVPFYDDFGWMRRASRGLDRHLIEDGLSNTILTLPLAWQQEIMLAWFDRFLNSGDDCPNIQRGFEVWWRRAFWRRNNEQQPLRLLQITAAAMENS